MIEQGRTYLVMGLLDPASIAFAIGETISKLGGNVVYTMQSERMRRIFLDRSKVLTDEEKAALTVRYCDVTVDEEVKAIFDEFTDVAGVVHSIAYANPKTALGEEFHTDAVDDLKNGFAISCVSLATVARHAHRSMASGGGIVTLTFESRVAFPCYNWMGVNKAALEATVRGLARRHGKDLIRVNAVSAGPLGTKAAKSIPGFSDLGTIWEDGSPLRWDTDEDKWEVANAVAFLVGNLSKKISGQTIYVDGGLSACGGDMRNYERAEAETVVAE
jgi:enoyl-[acyl-carrier protein] reductase I